MLKAIRLSGAAFVEAELKAPWSFCVPSPHSVVEALMPETAQVATCHVITEGGCTMKLGEGRLMELVAGEAVVLPRGDQHVVWRRPERAPDALTGQDISKLFSLGEVKPVRCGGGGEVTGMVSGFLAYDSELVAPMLAMLPRVIRISLNDDPRARWLQSAVRFSAQDAAQARGGEAAMLIKLSELLFAEAIRRYAEHAPGGRPGLVGALRDPHAARALAALHQRPGHPWTVEALADEVELSRSTLADRFARCVGQPPMQYLKKLRLRVAAERLLECTTSVGRVAEQAGYDSEASFIRAFKREFDLPPATWRRRRYDLE